jgi:hypothetical protein
LGIGVTLKQQKINRQKSKSSIIYERIEESEGIEPPAPKDDVPVRAVVFVEVKDMTSSQVGQLLAQINQSYKNARGGIHYIIPIRHGKIGADILFENEILEFVNKLCEVKDGNIVLKDGFAQINVVREIV